MNIAYISGPYSNIDIFEISNNIAKARSLAAELWRLGYAVICPHLNTAFFPDGPDYIGGDLEIISRLIPGKDIMVMLFGWWDSEGAVKEKELAEQIGLEIFYGKENSSMAESPHNL